MVRRHGSKLSDEKSPFITQLLFIKYEALVKHFKIKLKQIAFVICNKQENRTVMVAEM